MIGLIACVMLAQFKEGDMVYLKNDPTTGWITSKMASVRYMPSYGGSVSGSSVASLNSEAGTSTAPVVNWQKYTKVKVLSLIKTDGDSLVRVFHEAWKESYWFHADDLGLWTDEIEKKQADDAAYQRKMRDLERVTEQLKAYINNKSESAAINAAIAKGLDPLKMTAKEAAQLTPSERRAISAVRQRFRKGFKN